MARAAKTKTGSHRIRACLRRPVEDLWALWITKEGLEAWCAPGGCRLQAPTFDVGEEGKFEHLMTAVHADALAYMKGPEGRT